MLDISFVIKQKEGGDITVWYAGNLLIGFSVTSNDRSKNKAEIFLTVNEVKILRDILARQEEFVQKITFHDRD